jgi:hypothetical protein
MDAGPLLPVLGQVKPRVAPLPPVDWEPTPGAGRTIGPGRGRDAVGRRETCAPLMLAFPGVPARVAHWMWQGC